MTANTARGYTYPQSTDHARIWEHLQELATDIDADVTAVANRAICKLVQQTQQTGLTTGSDVVLTFDASSEEIDTDNFHDGVTNNSRVTPNKAGLYRIHVRPIYAFSTTITAALSFVRKNGSVVERSGNQKPNSTNNINTAAPTLNTILQANGTTDYFEAGCSFTGTANQATNNVAGSLSVFIVEYIRP